LISLAALNALKSGADLAPFFYLESTELNTEKTNGCNYRKHGR